MKPLSEQTFYEILEVRPDAPPTEIESAYTRARELYGPGSLATYSLVSPEEAALMAARIEDAKRILLDPDARARYDAGLVAVAEAAETAVRIAATGSGAVAAGLQRPWVAPSSATPAPPLSRPFEPSKADERKADGPKAEPQEVDHEQAEPSPASPEQALAASPVEPNEAAGVAAEEKPAEVGAAPPVVPAQATPILLQKEVPPDAHRGFPVPDGAVWSGEALRKVRESRGLSVREVCDRTKITRYHLENIEGDRFTLLPAPVYLRGIIVAVARELRLDGQKVARSYIERMSESGGEPGKAR